ncbi:MAG: MFS transporter [Rhodothermales bacterium]
MSGAIKRDKLFYGSCMALITTAIAFAVTGDIAFELRQEFNLTNAQIGVFAGVFLWGFTLSQVIFSPLCDTIGMRPIVQGAFVCHVAGALVMMFAGGFTMLVVGALVCGMGAGLVEAGCNPLVAALFPNDKTVKMNTFHMWFPFGILIGALILAWVLSPLGIGWQGKLLLIIVPALIYGAMMLTETYPATEGVSAGVSFSEMLKACVAPLMLVMLVMMAFTASLELGPGRWVPAVLASGGISGILVLGFVNGIMGTLRMTSKPVVEKLTPTGVLLMSSILATLGLFMLSYAESTFMAFATAAVWAVGIAYFWPTMLGFVSERIPKSGALGLGMMGAVGMAASGIATVWMGGVADNIGHQQLPEQETVAVFEQVVDTFPGIAANAGDIAVDIRAAVDVSQQVLTEYGAAGELPPVITAEALRTIISSGADSPAVDTAGGILNPADNFGGRTSFRYVAPFGLVLILVFGVLYIKDRRSGGYKQVKLTTEPTPEDAVAS